MVVDYTVLCGAAAGAGKSSYSAVCDIYRYLSLEETVYSPGEKLKWYIASVQIRKVVELRSGELISRAELAPASSIFSSERDIDENERIVL